MNPAIASAGRSGSSIARTFVDARQNAVAVPVWPGDEPASLDAAYAIQDEAIGLWPDRVAGWKLGRIPPPLDARFGAGRLAGPIFAANVWTAGSEPTAFGVIPGGFAAVEAEYVLELGQDVPSHDDWSTDQVADLVARAYIGIEIAGSPFPGINDHGPAVTAADFGNNAGLILGGVIDSWRERLPALTCRTLIDDVVIGTGGATSIPNGPLDSLAFLLKVLHRRGRTLTAGQLISTGAATGVHAIAIGQRALADFGPDGAIACVAVTAQGVKA